MKVCFVYSNRAEYSILKPYIDYFKPKTKTFAIDLSKKIRNITDDKNLHKIFQNCYNEFKTKKIDYICILGDRRELPFVVLAAFFLEIKVVHIGAGEYLEGIPTYDQIIRPTISILSNFQICFSKKATHEVKKLFSGISNLESNVHFFGNPVMSDVNLKKLRRPLMENYDLVLIHPQSLSRKNTEKDVKILSRYLKNKKTIMISGNKDRNYEIVENFYNKLKQRKNFIFYQTLSKQKYFSLVKFCDKFYTNTSSISEIKFLNKKCLVSIGLRNKGRTEHQLNSDSPRRVYNLLNKNYRIKH